MTALDPIDVSKLKRTHPWRANRGLKRIVRTMFEEAILAIPEGRFKCRLRFFLLKFFKSLPLRTWANRGETVVQGGCYMLETILEWREAVGPEGHVIAVEADPKNAEILAFDVKRRNLDNVTIVNKAVWSGPSSVSLEVSELSYRNKVKDASTLSPVLSEEHYSQTVDVPADALDNILTELGIEHVDHIHLTVSGADFEALEGLERSLSQTGTRVFVRAIMLDQEDGRPINIRVRDYLRQKDFHALCARKNPTVSGSNVYAWR